MEQLPAIEGITPSYLWIFLYVAVGIAALILLIDKVIDVFRRRAKRKEAKKPELADEIAGKVMDQLQPTFTEIDRKLANDKVHLDGHDRQIEGLARRMDGSENGIRALVTGVLALLNHELHNGNTTELNDAQKALNKYLIDK